MKYETTEKKISRMAIWEAIDDKTCKEALEYFDRFEEAIREGDHEYDWRDKIVYEEVQPNKYKLNKFLEQHPNLYPWMVRKGFLREAKPKFDPVNLLIESEEELCALWHRTNQNEIDFATKYGSRGDVKYYECPDGIWKKIDNIVKVKGLKG
jgi:hypothetical protein